MSSQPDLTLQALPCDFLAFLQGRLGVEAAADALGEWVVAYEPGPVARANAKASVKARPRKGATQSPEIHAKAAAA